METWQENETSIVLKMLDDSIKTKDNTRVNALQRSLLELERQTYIKEPDSAFMLPPPQLPPQFTPLELSSDPITTYSFPEANSPFSPKELEYLNKAIEQNVKQYEKFVKIIIVGNNRTGKTSLMNCLIGSKFQADTPNSVG